MQKQNIMYATIKGTLTENDGVFSGFNDSNYLALQNSFKLNANTVAEFLFKINLNSVSVVNGIMATPNSYGISFIIGSNNLLRLYMGNGSSWTLLDRVGQTTVSSNTDYFIKLTINKGSILCVLSTDKINWITQFIDTITITEEYTYNLSYGLGRVPSSQYLRGSIDIPNSYIKLGSTKYNLQAVFGYTKVGTLTIVDGVVSGFSSGNYVHILNFPNTFNLLEIVTKAKKSATGNQAIFALQNGSTAQQKFYLYMSNSACNFYYRSADDETKNISISYSVNVDVYYYFRLKISNSKIKLGYSTDGTNWVEKEVEDTMLVASDVDFRYGAVSNNGWYLDGSIDMNETLIKKDNKLWFNGQEG